MQANRQFPNSANSPGHWPINRQRGKERNRLTHRKSGETNGREVNSGMKRDEGSGDLTCWFFVGRVGSLFYLGSVFQLGLFLGYLSVNFMLPSPARIFYLYTLELEGNHQFSSIVEFFSHGSEPDDFAKSPTHGVIYWFFYFQRVDKLLRIETYPAIQRFNTPIMRTFIKRDRDLLPNLHKITSLPFVAAFLCAHSNHIIHIIAAASIDVDFQQWRNTLIIYHK